MSEEVEITQDVSIELECSECGKSLNTSIVMVKKGNEIELSIDPCETCLNQRYEEGCREA